MINALLVAMELNSMLPDETPANTEGYEGFFHLTDMSGNVERAEMDYIIRDHSEAIMTARKATLAHAVKVLNENTAAVPLNAPSATSISTWLKNPSLYAPYRQRS